MLATPLLCFPKADVVVGDLVPSTASFTNLNWPIQVSATAGAVFMAAAAILLTYVPFQEKKDLLLPTTS